MKQQTHNDGGLSPVRNADRANATSKTDHAFAVWFRLDGLTEQQQQLVRNALTSLLPSFALDLAQSLVVNQDLNGLKVQIEGVEQESR